MSDEATNLRLFLEGVYDGNGGLLTPELVREAARPADSPAHRYVFSVAPAEAAEEFYLERAHRLIQTVRVRVERGEGQPARHVRVWHAIPGEDTSYRYESLAVIRRDRDKFAAARTEAVRRLRQAEDAVEDLDALAVGTDAAGATGRAAKAVRRARQMVEAR